ncbi:MAG TPA: hypothetical protein VJX71_17945 [Methylomirabilota bacterium]|nr:hypothetical protein [Methylomirabilota bacterium]
MPPKMIYCHAPPSSRVIYTRLENGHVQVRYHWCEPADPMNVVLATIIGAESVRERGEYFHHGPDGHVTFHATTGARPPSTEPVEYWEWEEFRRLERLTGCASPVLL